MNKPLQPDNFAPVIDGAGPVPASAGCALRLGEELMIYQVAETWALIDSLIRQVPASGEIEALRIDCAELREIDGAGFQLLLLAARHRAAAGSALRLVSLNDRLRAQLTGLDPAGEFQFEIAEAA